MPISENDTLNFTSKYYLYAYPVDIAAQVTNPVIERFRTSKNKIRPNFAFLNNIFGPNFVKYKNVFGPNFAIRVDRRLWFSYNIRMKR